MTNLSHNASFHSNERITPSKQLKALDVDYAHYRAIHYHFFQDVYAWAGQPRQIRTAKGGNWFCYPEYIDTEMTRIFRELAEENHLAKTNSLQDFARRAAHYIADINAVHPFREGNGRCQLTLLDTLMQVAGLEMAAQKAQGRLTGYGWVDSKVEKVIHAIEAHSFSAEIEPTSIEAKVLQDADRLDAIGYTGVARCFYVSGRLARALYDPEDPEAGDRELNDLDFAIDHFKTKLLKLSGCFQTKAGQDLANARHSVVEGFLQGFLAEVTPKK
ncbi:Fic family protein [Roseobacter sp. HKCCD8198]|uniref:Fic family protein n=1 Tax=unclassified Roseobacter TaxID=196798 RepID=UPI00345FCCAC